MMNAETKVIKIALVQMLNSKLNFKMNMSKASEFVEKSASSGVDLIVFPKNWLLGSQIKTDNNSITKEGYEYWLKEASTREECINSLRKIAKKSKVAVLLNSLCKNEAGQIKNSAFFINQNGEVLTEHNETHRGDESFYPFITTGSTFETLEFCHIKFGILFDKEIEHPESARSLVLNGAEAIFILCDEKINCRVRSMIASRACENYLPILVCNYSGSDCGNSALVVPNEEGYDIPFKIDEEEKIFTVELSVEEVMKLNQIRESSFVERNLEVYSPICSKALLVEPRNWSVKYEEIKNFLSSIIKDDAIDIQHIGSTSLGIAAKPVIDIDVIAKDEEQWRRIKKDMEFSGFYEYKGCFGIKGRHAFYSKFFTKLAPHHVYLCVNNYDHVKFRDYLLNDKECLKQYVKIKQRLSKKYEFDLPKYTLSKGEFVERVLRFANNADNRLQEFRISSDKSEMEIEQIKRILDQSWWANGHSVEKIRRYVENSACFGVFNKNDLLIGFARTVTDWETFYYVWDFIIDKNYRARGIGTMLMKYIVEYGPFENMSGGLCSGVKKFYEQFGFVRRDNAFMAKDSKDIKN